MFVTNPRGQKLYIEAKDSLGFTDLTIGSGEVNPPVHANIIYCHCFLEAICLICWFYNVSLHKKGNANEQRPCSVHKILPTSANVVETGIL